MKIFENIDDPDENMNNFIRGLIKNTCQEIIIRRCEYLTVQYINNVIQKFDDEPGNFYQVIKSKDLQKVKLIKSCQVVI